MAPAPAPVPLAKIGPWGGPGGEARDVKRTPEQLIYVKVRADSIGVRSIYFRYKTSDGKTCEEGPWGNNEGSSKFEVRQEGSEYEIDLECGCDTLTEIHGKEGRAGNHPMVIKSLQFVTGKGKVYGPFGSTDGSPFRVPVLNGGRIEGFFGRSMGFLDAIGIYVKPN